ncbi:ImmA/IrrE family metallo-endopeptidase [Corynebacterium diphtheriae]|nr:ImmA/IrrE family metallo-endopeptidase [Corynebacterium diphtheriae]CAB0743659.1 ImmA/IrrE family metallo-endopeptidase [Corynebacterium diphtheriae]CAB0872482.1 ImmA/IrrE family metallo-endopeptidase [Corynebacterium diphtheriae]
MNLDELSQHLGVRILEAKDLPKGIDGMYIHHSRLILIRHGLDRWNYNSVLAHELGHAWHGDDIHGDPRLERRADQFAARLLISPIEYRLAESLHDGHIGAIAYELGVTVRLVEVWRDMHDRITA